jgi:micrococcal nuclease
MKKNSLVLTTIFAAMIATSASAADINLREFRGNVCYDGDTCYIDVPFLPDSLRKMSIRILGIDTPEIKGECAEEKALALKAREFANKVFRAAKNIEYKDLGWDKYGGRLLTNVYLDGKLYSKMIIDEKLARSYDGGTKKGWCD